MFIRLTRSSRSDCAAIRLSRRTLVKCFAEALTWIKMQTTHWRFVTDDLFNFTCDLPTSAWSTMVNSLTRCHHHRSASWRESTTPLHNKHKFAQHAQHHWTNLTRQNSSTDHNRLYAVFHVNKLSAKKKKKKNCFFSSIYVSGRNDSSRSIVISLKYTRRAGMERWHNIAFLYFLFFFTTRAT